MIFDWFFIVQCPYAYHHAGFIKGKQNIHLVLELFIAICYDQMNSQILAEKIRFKTFANAKLEGSSNTYFKTSHLIK